MKTVIFLLMILTPLAGQAQQATSSLGNAGDVKQAFCMKGLVDGGYANADRAEELCATFSQNTLGCAMDMIDMKMESDLFEAIEYCADPIVRR